MRLPDAEEFQKIYDALQDETSRKIYKHRLLYSFFHENEEINWIVGGNSSAWEYGNTSKVCFYGAGKGGQVAAQNGIKASFFIDTYRTGMLEGYPVISFEEFLKLPDFKEYMVLITVGKELAQHEIRAKLDRYA